MANLNVRIYNKYDTYENWSKSSLVLGAGEIAIASIPSGDGTGLTPPAIGVKVGDGSKTFSQLSWIQATAGDVYGWAKAATKPEYKAEEITGLADYISGEIQDTNTEYSFTLADNYKLKIQKKDLGGEFADYQVIDLTSAFAAKADKVANATAGNFAGLDAEGNLTDSGKKAADFATAAQGALADSALQKADITTGSANGTIAVEGADVAVKGLGSAAFTDASAYATAGHDHNSQYAAKDATEAHIANGDIHVTAEKKAAWDAAAEKAAANEEAIKGLQPAGDYATKAEAQGYADAKDEAIAAAKKAGDDAQAAVDALAGKVGEVPADKTVVQMIEEAQSEATYDDTELAGRVKAIEDDYLKAADKYDDTELAGRVTANEEAIALLNDGAEVEGSVDYKIAQAVAQIMENPDDTMNSINELVTWINGHATDALALSNQVEANKNDIAALEGLVGETGVAAQIEAAIAAALKVDGVDKYALASDLTAAIGRIAALEAKAHEHANKDVLDGISAAKVSAWDAAEQNAKSHADGLNTAMNTRVEALEAVDHEHANADVLDGISAEKVAQWDAAQANVLENVAGVEGSIADKTFTVTGVSTDLLKQGSETLIFNCGNSVV